MRYIFLVNSFSLKDETFDTINKIKIVADNLGLDYEIQVNSPRLSTENIIERYHDGQNIIMSLGGDGTINRVINNIHDTNNILGFIPLGTGNDFAKSVKEELHDGINKVDLVKINDKYFINLVCFGIDADIANDETFVDSKIIPRSQRYNASIVTNFFNYEPKHMQVFVDNEIFENDYTTIAVCNGKYYGRGFKMGPHASITDGLLDVYLINKMNKLAMIKVILGVKKGKHENSLKTTFIQTNKLKIQSNKAISCNYDGEKITSKNFDIEVIPKGIDVYYDAKLQEEFAKIKVKKR